MSTRDDASKPLRPVGASLPSGVLADVVDAEPLGGGAANDVWRLTLAGGTRLVLKASTGVAPDLYIREAEGLRALRAQGGLLTPRVVEVSPAHLLIEALEPAPTDDPGFWESAGRAVAGLHSVRGDRFGWPTDGWLGLLPQENAWADDGHAFFAVRRILRYVREPRVRSALGPGDLVGLESICDRLPTLIPAAPAVLNHGDLYRGNIVSTAGGEPAFIDPAVCWMWAEADLSMTYCVDRPPERFFAAYQEIRPLEDGWQDRMPLLHLRELLSVVAHFDGVPDCVARIRETVRRFS
ncbi:Fructosamine-3-kinase [Actinacidiphila yanglinensis]|uniref:Fructosamine-3-kinase n=1 Tax=Actinacidiphila yanglinensis TaxID=310779 RepID=A0A1H6E4P3_9ACTN|nr:fructosamine kinase family protein [Actinacidiphila yanglinensis]SEG92261.1 Fructosamine-3-kinase [Actinacidiphila yanglinensis]